VLALLILWKFKGIYNLYILPSYNASESKLAQLDTISLKVDSLSWQKIKTTRERALANGFYESKKSDYVEVKLKYLDKKFKAKIRLKGDLLDHFKGDRWSLRIKIKKKALRGIKKFSIQDPKTRKYIHEWIFQQLLLQEGLLGVKYDFVNVVINDENKGVYAFEEHFDEKYVQNRELGESYVLKFDETEYWENYFENKKNFKDFDNEMFLSSKIKSYTDFGKDSIMKFRFEQDEVLMEQIKKGKVRLNKLFDLKKWAKYMALVDLVGGHHGFRWNNVRLLKNGETNLIEPIGYDANAGSILENLLIHDTISIPPYQSDFFFNNDKIKEYYYNELNRVSDQEFLDNFFKTISEELINKLRCIYINNPEYVFEKEIYDHNQKYIREHLNAVNFGIDD